MFKNDTNLLDQHFLIDEDIINLFIKTCDIKSNDIVLEIGPGKGIITKKIANLCKTLYVVEKDIRLKPYLDNIDNTIINYIDVLEYDIPKVNKIITSLPYYITEPFFYKIIDCEFNLLIMICGKKLYNNILNKTKLGILIESYFDIEYISDIKPNSFDNPPRVMSSLLKLKPKDINILNKNDKIIRLLYKYRYLKVKNALKEILIKLDNITQREAKEIINNYNIDEVIINKLFDELNSEEVNNLINSLEKR